jgi:hypothetical protein
LAVGQAMKYNEPPPQPVVPDMSVDGVMSIELVVSRPVIVAVATDDLLLAVIVVVADVNCMFVMPLLP